MQSDHDLWEVAQEQLQQVAHLVSFHKVCSHQRPKKWKTNPPSRLGCLHPMHQYFRRMAQLFLHHVHKSHDGSIGLWYVLTHIFFWIHCFTLMPSSASMFFCFFRFLIPIPQKTLIEVMGWKPPTHRGAFRGPTSSRQVFNSATGNPCGFKLGPMDILGHSGQPIQDVRFVDFLLGIHRKCWFFCGCELESFLRKYMKGGGVVKSEVLLMVQNSGERTT